MRMISRHLPRPHLLNLNLGFALNAESLRIRREQLRTRMEMFPAMVFATATSTSPSASTSLATIPMGVSPVGMRYGLPNSIPAAVRGNTVK